jgi:nitrogen regulatory protein PII 2
MKEIMAFIRTKKYERTKEVLTLLGFPAMTVVPVLGRGRKFQDENLKTEDFNIIPKKMISLVVLDEDVNLVVEVIMKINSTGRFGDGKIFVCPINQSIKLRTDETGDSIL